MHAVVDLESTHLDPWRGQILTLTLILADKKYEEIDRFEGKIKPEPNTWWSEDAEQVHGINRHTANNFDNSRDVINELWSFLDRYKSNGSFAFVCHALPIRSRIDLFDYNFMFSWSWVNDCRCEFYSNFPEASVHSTIIRSKKKAQQQWGVENQQAKTWAKKLGIDYSRGHESSFDAELCLEILKYQKTTQGILK